MPLIRGSALAPATAGKPAILSGPRVPPLTLPPALTAIFGTIDGARTIGECLAAVELALPPDKLQRHGLRFFRSLWRTGHVAFRLKDPA